MLLDYQQQRLVHGMERNLQTGREQTARLAASLEALSPFRVLSRGYSPKRRTEPSSPPFSRCRWGRPSPSVWRMAKSPAPQRERRNTDGRKETDL